MHTIELPWPPSVNKMYESRGWGGQRRLATAAVAYRSVVETRCRDARKAGTLPCEPLSGRLQVTIHFYPPDQATRDLDNFNKAPLDALTKSGVWGDDGLIDRLIIDRAGVRPGGVLVVVIEPRPIRETDRLRPLFLDYCEGKKLRDVCAWHALPLAEIKGWLQKGYDLSDALCQRVRGDIGIGAP
jgi:crossover junction endodeoxyribonuclease RusA